MTNNPREITIGTISKEIYLKPIMDFTPKCGASAISLSPRSSRYHEVNIKRFYKFVLHDMRGFENMNVKYDNGALSFGVNKPPSTHNKVDNKQTHVKLKSL